VDFSRLDLNLLRTLDVLLAELNVTRAAQRLSLSQPAVSAQLKQLREWFGDPLLLPVARGMTPTALALTLQQPLRDALASLGTLVTSGQHFDPTTSQQIFHLVATDAVHATISAPLAASLQHQAPGIRLALYTPQADRLVEQLASGERDLALITPQAMPPMLRVLTLYTETFLCVMRRDHPIISEPLTLNRYCQLEHAMVSPSGGGFQGVVDEALTKLGYQRQVKISLPSFMVVPMLLMQSDYIATIPARLARAWQHTLAVVPPPCELTSFDIQLGWHPRQHADPAQRWLREQIKLIARQEILPT
jgi:Transcriptional regulator